MNLTAEERLNTAEQDHALPPRVVDHPVAVANRRTDGRAGGIAVFNEVNVVIAAQ